jgi:tryptophan aminotransferase
VDNVSRYLTLSSTVILMNTMPTAITQSSTVESTKISLALETSQTPLRGHGIDHQAMLSNTTKLRPESAIRSLFPVEATPGMLSLLAGKPNTATFPFSNIALTLKPVGEQEATTLSISGQDLEVGLQYGQTWGLPRLVEWLVQWQSRFHGRAIIRNQTEYKQDGRYPWRLSIGNGSQDLLTKTFNACINPGDSVLAECPAYT